MLSLIPGTVVSVSVGPVTHYGVTSDRPGHIISNSRRAGQVAEEPVSVFSQGRDIEIHGFPSSLHPAEVLERARSKLGESYNLFKWNCEHFVKWVHGFKPESRQLRFAAGICLAVMGIVYMSKRR